MFQNLASLESTTCSLIAAVALLLVVMLIAGGLVVSGPAILTFSIWISLFGLVAVGLAYGFDAALVPYMHVALSSAVVGVSPGEMPRPAVPTAKPGGVSAA